MADFKFTAFYYKAILEALQEFRRRNIKQLPDFSPYAPETQLERMMALVGHLVNCNIDILANELALPTAKLLQSAINIGNTLGYPFSQFSPAVATVVGKLSADITQQTTVLPALSSFSAKDVNTGAAINFENLEAFVLYDTKTVSIKYYSSLQNQYFSSPYQDVVPVQIGDCIYFGLETMFTSLNFALSEGATWQGVWEYWDGLYEVWAPIPHGVDNTGNLDHSGTVNFSLPQQINADWETMSIDSEARYWVRFRITQVDVGSTLPTLTSKYPSGTGDMVDADTGDKWIKLLVTQGITRNESFTSTGVANQTFQLGNVGLVEGSLETIEVMEGTQQSQWLRQKYMGLAGPNDLVFTYVVDSENHIYLSFGDGTTGKVPAYGAVISVSYRTVSVTSGGNVPAYSISGGDTGGKVLSFTNPRSAAGFKSAFAPLEFLKQNIPLWASTNSRAVTNADLEYFLLNNATGSGSSPASRVNIIDEGMGTGSIVAVLVGSGGGLIDSSVMTSIENYFNDKKSGILQVNKRLSLINYTPRHISISALVHGGNRNDIIAALLAKFQPLATRTADDGSITWQWNFNGRVPISVIIATIQDVPNVGNVVLYSPTSDVQLAANELPIVELSDISLDVRAV
jgi:hypothetical protein